MYTFSGNFGGASSGIKGGGKTVTKKTTSFGGTGGVDIKRPTVGMPTRGDFGPDPAKPTVTGPNKKDFGLGSAADPTAISQIKAATKEKKGFQKGFNDPTSTGAFQNLMKLANENTATQVSERGREARDAASRRGWAGGFESEAQQAAVDRMQAIATAGFEGAAKVREEELGGYTAAAANLAKLTGDYNAGVIQKQVAFGSAAQDAKKTQAEVDLGFGGLQNEKNIAFAQVLASAKEKQAELDSLFNNQMIDKARYDQMKESLEIQTENERMRLAEQARQFDASEKSDRYKFDKTFGMTEAEAARNRRERGVDPVTGRKYGETYRPGGFANL